MNEWCVVSSLATGVIHSVSFGLTSPRAQNVPRLGQQQHADKCQEAVFCTPRFPTKPLMVLKAHSHGASTPMLSVHTTVLFPIFNTGDMMLMLAKIKTCWILPQ